MVEMDCNLPTFSRIKPRIVIITTPSAWITPFAMSNLTVRATAARLPLGLRTLFRP
jgi:hypothetical protein